MVRAIGVVMAFGICIVDASAQTYPVKPIRMLFGYTAGNSGDVSARLCDPGSARRAYEARMFARARVEYPYNLMPGSDIRAN